MKMRKVVVYNHMTLDGVMQAPSHPDEDRRGGFEHGGWTVPNADEVMLADATEGMSDTGTLLLGRVTYEHFAASWPHQPEDNPFTAVMNNFEKLVASRTLKSPLEWNNSHLLEGEATEAVARLKEGEGNNLVVLGSGNLIQSLMRAALVDELILPIHPLVLGSGRRLFGAEAPYAKLELTESKPTTTGVIIAKYRPAA
jgi:dihydrofolate reductase